MTKAVTNRQIFFILVLILTGYSAISIPKDAINAIGTGSWITIILLTIIFAIGTFFIASLNKIFEGKTIFEYSKLLLGNFFGTIITLIYTINFIIVSIVITRNVIEFINECYLPFTPVWALLILVLFTCIYIAYKGFINLGKMSEIYGFGFISVLVALCIIMLFLGDTEYLKPFFETTKIKDYVFGVKDLIVPFLGVEILTIIPFGKENRKKGVLTSVLSVLVVGIIYILVVEASTSMIGVNTIKYYDNALVEALRETHLPATFFLERVDFLFLIFGIAGIISSICLIFSANAEFISKFFLKLKRENLFLGMGIVFFIICNFFISYEMSVFIFSSIIPIIGIFTMFVIPISLFCIAKVKKYG